MSLFRQALELGITFWDTANGYNRGTSEEAVGRALKELTRREDIVVATKVYFPMHKGPGGSGLSRKAILEQVDASLRRLGTDYIDLYQIHRFDPNTPVEETMEALHDVRKAGKVRYLGVSSMPERRGGVAGDGGSHRGPRPGVLQQPEGARPREHPDHQSRQGAPDHERAGENACRSPCS